MIALWFSSWDGLRGRSAPKVTYGPRAVRRGCSHFAPIRPRITAKHDLERWMNREWRTIYRA
jgi:hypothetical protein